MISTLSRPQFVLSAAALGFVCKLVQISGNAHANPRLPVCEWSAGYQQIFYRLVTTSLVCSTTAQKQCTPQNYGVCWLTVFFLYWQQMLIYLGRGTSETCLVSSAGRPSSPRDLGVIKNNKRMPSVCDEDSLECVSLEERRARKLKWGALRFLILKNLKRSSKASYILSDQRRHGWKPGPEA